MNTKALLSLLLVTVLSRASVAQNQTSTDSGNSTFSTTVTAPTTVEVSTTGDMVVTSPEPTAMTSAEPTAMTSAEVTTATSPRVAENLLVYVVQQVKRVFFRNTFFGVVLSTNADPTLEGSNVVESLYAGEDGSQFWALAADYNRSLIYYTDYNKNYFGVYNMRDQSHQKLFQGLSYGIDGITVDWFTGNIYWTDTDLNWIMVADSSLKYYTNIRNISSLVPAKIAVNPLKRALYWSETSASDCKIFKSDLNGKNMLLLQTFTEALSIDEISMDVSEDRLYWTDRLRNSPRGTARVRSFSLETPSNITTHYSRDRSLFLGLASYKNYIYLTERVSSSVLYFNKSTGAVFRTKSLSGQTPRSAVIYSADAQPWSDAHHQAHPCTNSNCDHLCLTDGWANYMCACALGYALQDDGATCGVTLVDSNFALLLDMDHKRIYQLPLDKPESYAVLPITNIGRPHTIDYDVSTRQVYWSDSIQEIIMRSNLNGSAQQTILSNIKAYSIAIEAASRNLYIADAVADAIKVMSMDHANVSTTLHVHNIHRVYKLMASHTLGKVFWADWGQIGPDGSAIGMIEAMNLDGSGRESIANETTAPFALTIDYTTMNLFWTEVQDGSIRWVNLDSRSGGRYSLGFTAVRSFVVGVAYYSGYLYVTDIQQPSLYRVPVSEVLNSSSLAGAAVAQFGPAEFYALSAIRIVSNATTTVASACSVNRGGCPEICLPRTNGRTCACADHSTFVQSNNTCTIVRSTVDEVPPSFGSTCPRIGNLRVGKCSNTAFLNFTIPTATDNSGTVIVKPLRKQPPPYQLPLGFHAFYYRAQDLSGNLAHCQFVVLIYGSTDCRLDPFIPAQATASRPSCGEKYGSTIDVRCNDSTEVNFQYECNRFGTWAPNLPAVCPSPSPSVSVPTTTSTTSSTISLATSSSATTATKPQPNNILPASAAKGGLSGGAIAAIVIVVITAIAVAGFLLMRYRDRLWFSGKVFWSKGDDTLQLTDGGNTSFVHTWPTAETNVYV